MANTNPETLQDLQDEINTLVSNDNDTPEEGDDEWVTRNNLIWTAIRTWGNTKDVFGKSCGAHSAVVLPLSQAHPLPCQLLLITARLAPRPSCGLLLMDQRAGSS